MRLLELDIQNVRGIPELHIKPGGRNFVIWGPNGSGKSGVVDAIDFLLTGRIARLTGKGTGDISLAKHGTHIDRKPEEAIVRARIAISGFDDAIEIQRCMSRPTKLECSMAITPRLQMVLNIASRGQHVLTRRDILKYITAEASTRAQEIQELLNISEVEDVRKVLVKVQSTLDKDAKSVKRTVDAAISATNTTTGHDTFDKAAVLKYANENRATLGGSPIEQLKSADLKVGLAPPSMSADSSALNVTLLEKDVENLRSAILTEHQKRLSEAQRDLLALVKTIHANPQLVRALSRQQLIQSGLELIDETGNCPLCDTPWPAGQLRTYLESQLVAAEEAAEYQKQIRHLSSIITGPLNRVAASLKQVIKAAESLELLDHLSALSTWATELENLSAVLSDPVKNYPDAQLDSDRVKRLMAPNDAEDRLLKVHDLAKKKYPHVTPEQTAWDTLTRLEENLKAIESGAANFRNALLSHKRGTILLDSFIAARDHVLGSLYEDIKDRFVELYKQLHAPDESTFTAEIEPEDAGLNFKVDFHGRGAHPPHALHSEGHQDSMGICLYLALAERLTKGLMDLVILDDVVMSIDSDHRRHVCRLLAQSFPERQFLITTHDKTWANQLKTEGIVTSQEKIEFYNWHVETGPLVNYETGIWKRIEQDIQKGDIATAAGRLRRGAEEFFALMCDGLKAPVPFKLNGRWELGDFLPAAMKQYRSMLRQAKKAAQSWSDNEKFEMLQELDSTVGPIYTRTNAEQWAVNANVHYNNWADFLEDDFRPVYEAFQDLCALFVCSECGGALYIVQKEVTPVAIRCSCGAVDWNLIEKGHSA